MGFSVCKWITLKAIEVRSDRKSSLMREGLCQFVFHAWPSKLLTFGDFGSSILSGDAGAI